MTPLQFAKAECSNFDAGTCKGIGIKDDGSLYSFGAKPKCVLGTPGIRCEFFEECVAPMAGRMGNPRLNQDYTEAAKVYRTAANVPTQPKRACPGCGRDLEPRRRFCYVCADSRQKQANRERTRNKGSEST